MYIETTLESFSCNSTLHVFTDYENIEFLLDPDSDPKNQISLTKWTELTSLGKCIEKVFWVANLENFIESL